MHKFLSLSLLSSLFFTAQYLHAADADNSFNRFSPHDKSKLEFYCCTAHCPQKIVDLIAGRYFTSIDQETYRGFYTKFVFGLSDLLIERHRLFQKNGHKSKIVGDFFYQTSEIDPASHFTDLERLKACDQNKRFLSPKTFKIVAVNGQPLETYIKTLEELPAEEAVLGLLMYNKPTFTVEPCEPNPTGKIASLDWSV
jgi:hypothetical protein